MHGVDKAESLLDAALLDQSLDRPGDVDEATAVRDFKPKMFSERFHGGIYNLQVFHEFDMAPPPPVVRDGARGVTRPTFRRTSQRPSHDCGRC